MLYLTTGNTELGKLIKAAGVEKPKKTDLDALDTYIDGHGLEELTKIGDLGRQMLSSVITFSFKENYGIAQAISANISQQRQDLGYDNSSPLEKQLINHLLLCWLRLHDTEIRYDATRSDNPTMAQMQHWEKRLSAAQRRYLRAVETLAKVRRLLYKPENRTTFNLLLKQQLSGK